MDCLKRIRIFTIKYLSFANSKGTSVQRVKETVKIETGRLRCLWPNAIYVSDNAILPKGALDFVE